MFVSWTSICKSVWPVFSLNRVIVSDPELLQCVLLLSNLFLLGVKGNKLTFESLEKIWETLWKRLFLHIALVWERRGISLETKLKVYQAVVLTTLLYSSETWTVYRRHKKILNHFHFRCLRSLLHNPWQDKAALLTDWRHGHRQLRRANNK